jgi:hypothetical protein
LRRRKFSSSLSDQIQADTSSSPSSDNTVIRDTTSALQQQDKKQHNNNNNNKPAIVYGTVKTHAPAAPQKPQVRDPAKEILGLWRGGGLGGGGGGLSQTATHRSRPPHRLQAQFGRLQTHSRPATEPSQFQLLQDELYGGLKNAHRGSAADPNLLQYGTVHHYEPATSKTKAFETVRTLLQNELLDDPESDQKNAFDRIREKLLNTRARERVRSSASRQRGLRRKGSQKRRRNVSSTFILIDIKNYVVITNLEQCGIMQTLEDIISLI